MGSPEPDSDEPKNNPWPGYILGIYALTAGLGSVLFENFAAPGWGIYTRPLLGLLGVAGGMLLLLRDTWWKTVLSLWILAQVPVIIVDPSGELTRQQGVFFSFKATGPMTWSNGTLSDIHAYGVNLAAIALLFLASWIMVRGWYPPPPGPRWMRFFSGAIELGLAGLLVVILVVGCRWARPFMEKDVVLVLDASPPGTEVYGNDKMLGLTPLVVTARNLVDWGLSKPGGPYTYTINLSANDNAWMLFGLKSGMPLWFKPPGWCIRHFQTMQTPAGIRAVPLPGYWGAGGSNYLRVPFALKAQPGLVLTEESVTPADCRPGQKVEFVVRLRSNPPNPNAPAVPQKEHGNRAELKVSFWRLQSSSHLVEQVNLPAGLAQISPGQEARHAFQLPAPNTPGTYIIQYKYQFFLETKEGVRTNDVWSPIVRAFGLLRVD